ncbi:MAG: hypothetical protein DWP95_09005 [Proteobacteria bacterium]|nr:MAG: hypothetical protein DWP95_09005 [Pseudomonadota bacterium]
MISHIHRLAAITATLSIALFFSATIIIELFGTAEAITIVKSRIVFPGLLILISAIILTGGSGFALSKNRRGRLTDQKKKRMPIIAANGVFILIPCAVFLDKWAAAGSFGTAFYLVQSLELLAGAVNLTLMGLNMRDGLRLTGKIKAVK